MATWHPSVCVSVSVCVHAHTCFPAPGCGLPRDVPPWSPPPSPSLRAGAPVPQHCCSSSRWARGKRRKESRAPRSSRHKAATAGVGRTGSFPCSGLRAAPRGDWEGPASCRVATPRGCPQEPGAGDSTYGSASLRTTSGRVWRAAGTPRTGHAGHPGACEVLASKPTREEIGGAGRCVNRQELHGEGGRRRARSRPRRTCPCRRPHPALAAAQPGAWRKHVSRRTWAGKAGGSPRRRGRGCFVGGAVGRASGEQRGHPLAD